MTHERQQVRRYRIWFGADVIAALIAVFALTSVAFAVEEGLLGAGDYQLTLTTFGGTASVCGDGDLAFDEQCDDGNTVDGDCCTATCRFEPTDSPCGNTSFCDAAGRCEAAPCIGDCNNDREVKVNELVRLVNVALERIAVSACIAGDRDRDGSIAVARSSVR